MHPKILIRTTTGLAVLGLGVLLVVAAWTGPTASAQDGDLLELGKRVYDETAGGVGCAYCHGLDGLGQGTAGVDAPAIVGAQDAALRSSLAGAVPLMNFITLTETEFQAVLAYLAHLATPAERPAPMEPVEPVDPEEDDADAPETAASATGIEGPTGILTFNIVVTDEGFSPSSISIPLGRTVQIVLRNRTFDEHHFRVQGLPVADLMWIEHMGDTPPAGADDGDHEHHGHNDHAALADVQDDHDDHDHPMAAFVTWRAASPGGIQPTGNEVHAWAYTYSPNGGRDVVIFTPLESGTFVADDPLHPGMTAEVIVHD